jgi:predicted  nucleic acid-binding Zn-ribbon protein
VKASPDDQLRLLDLQALDSALDRLAQRRRSLPELAEIEQLQNTLADLDDKVVIAQTEDSDLGREQAKLETDIDVVRSRMERDQKRLDAGQVGSPRELENLQSEIASLHRRQTELEDEELELMERREQIEAVLRETSWRRSQTQEALDAAEQRRDAALSAIADDEAKARAERDPLAASLPGEMVTLYEKLRASSGGVGAAALHRGRCEGCHLALNTQDLNRVRDAPPDDVLRCEECRRILVRTAESGL